MGNPGTNQTGGRVLCTGVVTHVHVHIHVPSLCIGWVSSLSPANNYFKEWLASVNIHVLLCHLLKFQLSEVNSA